MVCLIVDDSRSARNLLKSYIGEIKLGQKCDFVEAEDGRKALQILQTNHIDMVLLDWNLSSSMTGLDILKIIRQLDKFKNMPVIMVTGESDKQNVIVSLKCGANDFISKPIDKKLLSDKILKALTKQ